MDGTLIAWVIGGAFGLFILVVEVILPARRAILDSWELRPSQVAFERYVDAKASIERHLESFTKSRDSCVRMVKEAKRRYGELSLARARLHAAAERFASQFRADAESDEAVRARRLGAEAADRLLRAQEQVNCVIFRGDIAIAARELQQALHRLTWGLRKIASEESDSRREKRLIEPRAALADAKTELLRLCICADDPSIAEVLLNTKSASDADESEQDVIKAADTLLTEASRSLRRAQVEVAVEVTPEEIDLTAEPTSGPLRKRAVEVFDAQVDRARQKLAQASGDDDAGA